jgi:NitT/TauT family transport system permease protein
MTGEPAQDNRSAMNARTASVAPKNTDRVGWYWYPVPAIVFIAVWQIYTSIDPSRQFIFSSPEQVINRLFELVVNLELFHHSLVTLMEAVIGFMLGTVCGAAIGLSFWCSRKVALVAKPYITALASVPIFALAPVIIFGFGIGMLSKVVLAFVSTCVVAVVQSYQGAMSAEPRFLKLMHVMGANRAQTFKIVVLPSALIWVINAMKLNIGLALLGAFIGELISAEQGLGYMIFKASGLFDMATVIVGVLALIVISLIATYWVEALENRLMRWKVQ